MELSPEKCKVMHLGKQSIPKDYTDEIAQIVYPTFIRSHLEFVSSVWNPHLEYDSKTLESIQLRATLTKESQHLPYEERLKRFGLTYLKTRRERGDFI